ncbi:MAG: nucleotidyltransferase domain-containing protein [Nanoarchaeota archaeon]|nr:nucleotidyltransferase domain-containing protein [Nanoarchaeota archaeon]
MGGKKHIAQLKEFKRNLSKKITIKKMILFGSMAFGKPSKWSDFDLIIVSKNFKGKKFRYRPIGFHNYWKLDYPVDFICYTPEEFNKLKKQITIVKEAVEHGIEI